jgi:hypothetical protein
VVALWVVGMLVKIIILFLAAMALVAMLGKWLFPGALSRKVRGTKGAAPVCSRCGRYLIGKGGCDCRKKG